MNQQKPDEKNRSTHGTGFFKIGSLLLLVVLTLHGIKAGPAAGETLKIGIYNNEPLIFTDTDGKGRGIFADVVEYVAAKKKWRIEYVPGTFPQCLKRLKDDKIDLLCTIAFSHDRDRLYDFNKENLLTNWGQLYTHNGSGIKAITDLSEKTVAVLKEDIHFSIFTQLITNFGIKCRIIETDDYHSVLDLVSRKQVDAGIVNRLFGMQYGVNYNVNKSGVIFNPIKIHFAAPEGKNKALLAAMDRHIALLKKDDDSLYYKSLEKWLGAVSAKQMFPRWIFWAIWVGGGLMVVLFLGNLILRRRVRSKTKAMTSELIRRKKAETSLRENEEKFRGLVELSSDWIWEIDTKGVYTYVSPNVKEMLGYSPEDVVGKTPFELMPQKEATRVHKIFKDMMEKARPIVALENTNVHKNGRHIILETSGVPVFDREGNIRGYRGVDRDITDRKRAEKQLKQSEMKYRTVLEANPDPVVVYDIQGKVTYFNPAFTRVFGWTLEDHLGKKMDVFVPEDAWRETEMMIGKLMSGERFSGVETHRYNKKKEIVPVSISGTIYADQEGRPVGSIINLRDISDQKKMEAQLQQAQKMEAIGTLAGGIAHDFNNILSAILGYSELALADLPAETPMRNKLEAIHSSGKRARDLVTQILAYSRKDEQVRTPVQLDLVLKDTLRLLRPAIPTTIEIQTQINCKCSIIGDPTKIHQIIMNLCTNAYQAMLETGGTLGIGLSHEKINGNKAASVRVPAGRYGKLVISDTGVGIPSENMERIFDPYFTTKEKGKGTGLGLAATHGIVKSHKGAILVDSRMGQGTRFVVYLPLIQDKIDTDDQPESQIVGGRERILLIDDEPTILTIEKEMLKRQGYAVTSTGSALKALKIFEAQPEKFDLVITDMTMPNITGDELAGKLIKIRPDIPIILCTGFSELISSKKAASLGIKGFLMKPVTMRELSNLIREVIDNE